MDNRKPNVIQMSVATAWSVQSIQMVPNADAEMAALTDFNPKSTAIVDARYTEYCGRQI